jgi:hypothetical protein
VATGTGDGGHHFSKTLEEHNAAVKSYLDHLRAQQHAASKPKGQTQTGAHGSDPR